MNKNIDRVIKFLDDAGCYYLATIDNDVPRVRPFGTALCHNDKLYIQTGKVKDVSKQIVKNPNVEICAFKDGDWVRISGKLVRDEDRVVKTKMLDKMPVLRHMYNEDDGNMEMLYFEKAHVKFTSFSKPSEEFDI